MTSRSRFVAAAVVAIGASIAAIPGLAAGPDQRLADAVQRKDAATATSLLKQSVDVNAAQPDGATPLAWAAHWDDVKLAGQLVEASADDAFEAVRRRTVFTTHTPVPAGNDTYPAAQVEQRLGGIAAEMGVDVCDLVRRGRTNPDDENEPFGVTRGMTKLSHIWKVHDNARHQR